MLKDFEKIYPGVDPNLNWYVSDDELMSEFFFYLNHERDIYSLNQSHNKIVKYFQQDNFFLVEKQLWQDDNIKQKILDNRCKYLFKKPEELTTYDILSGFKKSAIHYGYSGFNPFIIKKFIKDNNCHVVYDPCGGWGHRMLGATEADMYIYNDLSTSVYESVNDIKNYFDMFNTVTYNNDARSFIPEEEFDAMFTCPPYFNLEHYECGDFVNREEFDKFIDSLFEVFYKKDSCKIFGLVIREDLLGKHTNYNESYKLNKNRAIHLTNNKPQINEYLYVYQKQ